MSRGSTKRARALVIAAATLLVACGSGGATSSGAGGETGATGSVGAGSGGGTWKERERLLATYSRAIVKRVVEGSL